MKNILTLILITISFSLSAQKKYYNNAVNSCPGTSSIELIECIKGTYLLGYDFTSIDGKVISTSKIKKPIVIVAAATWSGPFWGGMPALNQIVKENHDKIQFIMIFWDKEAKIKKMAHKIDKHIALIPAREKDKVERGNLDISGFIHKIQDYPTAYLINKNKQFIDVTRGAESPSKKMKWEEVTKVNLANLNKVIAPLLK